MHSNLSRVLGFIIGAALCSHAPAQQIQIKALLTNAGPQGAGYLEHYNETSLSVSRFKPDQLIVATNYQPWEAGSGVRKVWYGISMTGLDGPEPFTERGFLPDIPN